MLKGLLDFLFGKNADVFDDTGRVRHKFSDQKWQKWNDRLLGNPEYDWRNHSARESAKKPLDPKNTPKN